MAHVLIWLYFQAADPIQPGMAVLLQTGCLQPSSSHSQARYWIRRPSLVVAFRQQKMMVHQQQVMCIAMRHQLPALNGHTIKLLLE